jgi:hypothetical protein
LNVFIIIVGVALLESLENMQISVLSNSAEDSVHRLIDWNCSAVFLKIKPDGVV